jgi:hypothetical protein
MKLNIFYIFIFLAFCTACHETKKINNGRKESLQAKRMLAGVWLDDDTDEPYFQVKGDTIYYPDVHDAPVYFKVIRDTLYTFGKKIAKYKIDRQTNDEFWFHSFSDNIVKIYKSDDPEDSLAFHQHRTEVIPTYNHVVKRDSVIFYKGDRYHAYVYINPSNIKVKKTSYNEDGFSVDNEYYDNIMHICVYQGKHMVYGSDLNKMVFSKLMPVDFLKSAIFSDMQFIGVSSKGFLYQASVCIPEGSECNIVNVYIDFKGHLTMKLGE